MDVQTIVSIAKDTAQVAFWITAGTIAWLSYAQAKKSIFQPAKNEVFKVQVEKLQELMQLLNWRSSLEAWEESGLESSFSFTVHNIFKQYAKREFGAELDVRNKTDEQSVGIIVSRTADFLTEIKGPADESERDNGMVESPRLWKEYKWETFEISSKLFLVKQQLEEALNNPVFPTAIIFIISELLVEVHETSMRAASDMEIIAREFPRHYKDQDSLKNADLTWCLNMRTERGEKLFLKLNELKQEIRNYLQTDTLFGK
ncbi:hypothetical protein [Maritalea sp.]|jgi:hypothetical protein|uniref:hypothetical protein n=1 Tax=Maritalea sp. TaxID=2003361 RepID=UPI0039E55247